MYAKKKIPLVAVALFSAAAVCADGQKALTLSQARGKIGEAIANQSVMAETVRSLSPVDQVSFLAAVNAAIAKNPGSKEAKAALYLQCNATALKAAKESKGDIKALLSEVFATAEISALCPISEYFGDKLFNRSADPEKTFSDESFQSIAKAAISAVAKRCASVDNASVRTSFCIVMFMRASGGTSEELLASLVGVLPASDREKASKEWLPSALGLGGKEKTYEPMLAESDSESQPNIDVVVSLTSMQEHDAVLSSLPNGAVQGALNFHTQMSANQTPLEKGDDVAEPKPYQGQLDDVSEPKPYQGQKF